MLGFALIALFLSSRGQLPTWVRWFSLGAGFLAIGAPFFFPAFAIPIWGSSSASGSSLPDLFRARRPTDTFSTRRR